jgi:phosphatidylglycerophosphatase A
MTPPLQAGPPANASTSPSPPPSRRHTFFDALAHLLSIWFGCGLVPYAPGTAGTIGALPLYLLLQPLGPVAVLLAAAVVAVVGVWASHRTAARLGIKDPPIVCIDEVAGVLLTWSAAPPGWAATLTGFVLFRIADQVKPWPARVFERRLPGGFGIVFDDLAAGVWAALAMLAARASGMFG